MSDSRKILIGSTNKEKNNIIKDILKSLPVEILTLEELGIKTYVQEDGQSPLENAQKKAMEYWKISKISTLALDAALHIDELPEQNQPGLNIRRLEKNAKQFSDEELLNYYSNELEKIGGKSKGKYIVGMVLITSKGKLFSYIYNYNVHFTSICSTERNTGAPLSSLGIDPRTGKYFSQLKPLERPDAKWIYDFVKEHINDL